MALILVESPTKAKTLSRFLGGDYEVKATYGHVRDLPEKKLGIAIEKTPTGDFKFEPEYVMADKQKERMKEIEKALEGVDKIYLATDPDREGEAIAYHVREVLLSDIPKARQYKFERIVFHEITQQAIKEAITHPREVDMKLVDAQQARRVLDRLVGYKLSPLLWRKVRKGLSAGRVQSVAVRLVVEREKEITDFKPEEYWVVGVNLSTDRGETVLFSLTEKDGEKIKVGNEADAKQVEEDLSGSSYTVATVVQKEVVKTPPAPFTTSTLQQAAANKLGWSAKKTMQVAQMLYEEGNITYHRTDSTNLAGEAIKAAAAYIGQQFGREYALSSGREYKTKSKVAQEAHEAIRPTDMARTGPTDGSNRDQEKLYELIWKRFMACQMAEAKGLNTKVGVKANATSGGVYGLEAKGEKIVFDGWLKVYGSKYVNGENGNGEENAQGDLPAMSEGDKLKLEGVVKEQKFTAPPARYNDASLIKALEERGIGRPSTYAPILSTIQDRQYVERQEKRFAPTALGVAVNEFLVTNFPNIVDFGFTAGMEEQLDEIANGDREWRPVVTDFYIPFEKDLDTVGQKAERVKVEVETTGEKCPKCSQGDVVIRIGRFGKFLACSRYPECDYKNNYQEKIGVKCPKCGGEVIVRKTKTRKSFFGCSNYPNCDFASWTKPKAEVKS